MMKRLAVALVIGLACGCSGYRWSLSILGTEIAVEHKAVGCPACPEPELGDELIIDEDGV